MTSEGPLEAWEETGDLFLVRALRSQRSKDRYDMLQASMHLHSTNPMILPVLPPILFNAFPARLAAPLMAGPAELVTRERPSDAWLTALEPVCCAFEAALDAASVVEEAFRMLVRRRRNCDCRKVARERARGMAGGQRGGY
jgi:hypothetical protein